MTKKQRRFLSLEVKVGKDRELKIIGRLEKIPEIGEELTYVSDGQKKYTQEIVKAIKCNGVYDRRYPGRLKIITDRNIYISDDLIIFNENQRGRGFPLM